MNSVRTIVIFARVEAIAQLKRALTLNPNFYYARYNLGAVYHAKGLYSEAIVEYRKARELDDDPLVTALLARLLAKSGGRMVAIFFSGGLWANALLDRTAQQHRKE